MSDALYITNLTLLLHFTKDLWAHNWNFINTHLALRWKLMTISFQNSTHAMTAVLLWHGQNWPNCVIKITIIAKWVSTKFQLWNHKLFVKWTPGPAPCCLRPCHVPDDSYIWLGHSQMDAGTGWHTKRWPWDFYNILQTEGRNTLFSTKHSLPMVIIPRLACWYWKLTWVQIVGYVMACRLYWFVCTLHHLIIIIVQTYL